MNLVDTFPVSTGRSAGEGLDMFVAVEIRDTFVDGMTRRTACGE